MTGFLGRESTEPVGSPDLRPYCLVDMFCSCTEVAVKVDILKAFSIFSLNLRIVVATIAFGMGLACPNDTFGPS